MKMKRKYLIIFVLLIILVGYFLFTQTGKVDDWQYQYNPTLEYSFIIIPCLIVIIPWIAISLYLIIKGKPIIKDKSKKTNPKRIMGISLLLFPVILLFVSFISILTIPVLILVLPIIIIAFFIWAIIYSIKNKIKIALVGLVIIIIIFVIGGLVVFLYFSGFTGPAAAGTRFSMLASVSEMGYSVGGAKDIDNFRRNVENNYLPLPTDITYEGLFYDYYFDTGEKEACKELFCPSYSYAISQDPFSHEDEYYLSVGLNSGMKKSDFQRKKLNLVIVLDISGSMSSSFSRYYYDRFGKKTEVEISEEDLGKSKMEVARESVVDLLGHLNDDDSFGMVLFDGSAYIAKPLRKVGNTDMVSIKNHILELTPRGSTNFEAGYKAGTSLLSIYSLINQDEYENRIIFLTDAMPNVGDISEEGLFGLTKKNADNNIYTTFIGIGVDFNTELIEHITKIRGANYYSVHSSTEFKTRMDDEFEYMVTPLVFNLIMKLEADGYEIEKVYGSPEANEATGEIMKVNTLFPSSRREMETRGGIIILKLRKVSPVGELKLTIDYENRKGESMSGEEKNVQITETVSNFYENTGIRKGILLSRYADLMKNWINDERESIMINKTIEVSVTLEEGVVIPVEIELGKWERQSVSLRVSEEYKQLFSEFLKYFKEEMEEIGDDNLSKEVTIIEKLIKY